MLALPTYCKGSVLVSSLTGLDSTQQENMFLFVRCELENCCTVIHPPMVSVLWFRARVVNAVPLNN